MNDPDLSQLMEKMKWELAKELGITLPRHGYYGGLSTRDCGKLGSELYRRAKIIYRQMNTNQESEPAASDTRTSTRIARHS